MKLINLTDSNKVIKIGNQWVTLLPKVESPGYILGTDDLRQLLVSNSPEQLKFIITNPSIEMQLLSNLNANLDFIYEHEIIKENETNK